MKATGLNSKCSIQSPFISSGYRVSQGGCDFRMNIPTLINNAGPFEDVVGHIDLEIAFVQNQGHETGQVARVELAGVPWHRGRKIEWPQDDHTVVLHGFTRTSQGA